jgi:hypothetical protein
MFVKVGLPKGRECGPADAGSGHWVRQHGANKVCTVSAKHRNSIGTSETCQCVDRCSDRLPAVVKFQ